LYLFYFYLRLKKGKKIDGLWHTSKWAFEQEYYFGFQGIISSKPVIKNI
jgi:hypothetical protein